jgi:hypothetical protein
MKRPDLPSWLPPQIWAEYEKMRVRIKKPMTDYARQLAIAKLERYRAEGIDPVQVLEESILNSWQGLFVPRNLQRCRRDGIQGQCMWTEEQIKQLEAQMKAKGTL